jgi:hypothetical protein
MKNIITLTVRLLPRNLQEPAAKITYMIAHPEEIIDLIKDVSEIKDNPICLALYITEVACRLIRKWFV